MGRALLGDAGLNRAVERADIMLLRAHMNETVDSSNFALDLDLGGSVEKHDGRIVRLNKTHTVP